MYHIHLVIPKLIMTYTCCVCRVEHLPLTLVSDLCVPCCFWPLLFSCQNGLWCLDIPGIMFICLFNSFQITGPVGFNLFHWRTFKLLVQLWIVPLFCTQIHFPAVHGFQKVRSSYSWLYIWILIKLISKTLIPHPNKGK